MKPDKALVKQSESIAAEARTFRIATQTDYGTARDSIKAITDIEKQVKAKKDEALKPALATVAAIREYFRPTEDLLQASKDAYKTSMVRWVKEEAERVAREEAKILSDKRIKNKEDYLINVKQVTTSATRKVDVLVIVDEALIPREYLVPNEAMIKAALKAGKKVPGCKFEKETKIVAR